MPDDQGNVTDDEIRDSLGRLVLPDSPLEVLASSKVKKVVACGGVVKIWILKEIGPNAAKAVHDRIRDLPGVQEVNLVPVEADESLSDSNI